MPQVSWASQLDSSSCTCTLLMPCKAELRSHTHTLPICVCVCVCETHLHVLCDRCVADGVGSSRDGGLAAVAAAAAVQAGHVDPVQVVVVLPAPVAQRLVLAVLPTPAEDQRRAVRPTSTSRGSPAPSDQRRMGRTKELMNATMGLMSKNVGEQIHAAACQSRRALFLSPFLNSYF